MAKYFNDLGVPKHRTRLLLGRLDGTMHDSLFPSRENIIKTLHDIRSNPLIETGDLHHHILLRPRITLLLFKLLLRECRWIGTPRIR